MRLLRTSSTSHTMVSIGLREDRGPGRRKSSQVRASVHPVGDEGLAVGVGLDGGVCIEGIALRVVRADFLDDGAGACAEAVVYTARDDDDVVGLADAEIGR